MTEPLPVVVGVDGSESAVEASRWAALEDGRSGAGLRGAGVLLAADPPRRRGRAGPAGGAATGGGGAAGAVAAAAGQAAAGLAVETALVDASRSRCWWPSRPRRSWWWSATVASAGSPRCCWGRSRWGWPRAATPVAVVRSDAA
jgi:nucleotide-binding universal stress UspA family protein